MNEAASAVPKWFERKFEFSIPLEQWPNICARVRGTPARLEEFTSGVERAVLITRRNEKWSVQENAGHLLSLEALWIERVGDFLNGSGSLTVADLWNRATSDADYNAQSLDEILAAFREARGRLMRKIAGIGAAEFGRSLMHPRLKQPMRLVDHLYFVAEHDDHHLARILELVDGKPGQKA
jgi:hypothetical protein